MKKCSWLVECWKSSATVIKEFVGTVLCLPGCTYQIVEILSLYYQRLV